jgi:hypothetical protein
MYIYNVTIKITPAIELEWIDWMKNEHMDEVIATGAFDRYSFYKLIDPISEDDDGITYSYNEDLSIWISSTGEEKSAAKTSTPTP